MFIFGPTFELFVFAFGLVVMFMFGVLCVVSLESAKKVSFLRGICMFIPLLLASGLPPFALLFLASMIGLFPAFRFSIFISLCDLVLMMIGLPPSDLPFLTIEIVFF